MGNRNTDFHSELWSEPEEVRQVDATVVAVLPEFHQAKLRDSGGYQYSITDMTAGVHVSDLQKGQHVRCIVTTQLPRVIRASIVG